MPVRLSSWTRERLRLAGLLQEMVWHIFAAQKQLHVDHIQPAAKLIPNLPEACHLLEPQRRLQSQTGYLFGTSAADDCVMAGRTCSLNQVEHQRPPDPTPLPIMANVDRRLHASGVGAARLPRGEGCPTDNLARRLCDDDRMGR